MSTSRPFGFNPEENSIDKTEQYGDLVVGNNSIDLPYDENYGGVEWWNGPDEDLGYVIATLNVDRGGNGKQPTPVIDKLGSVQFWRTDGFDEGLFIDLVLSITGLSFNTNGEAISYLLSNGYWTSYEL
jgi:hypothetical protein